MAVQCVFEMGFVYSIDYVLCGNHWKYVHTIVLTPSYRDSVMYFLDEQNRGYLWQSLFRDSIWFCSTHSTYRDVSRYEEGV